MGAIKVTWTLRIAKKNIIKDITKGGLRKIQIHVDSFVTALKVTWPRRLISQPSCTWSSLSYINMDSLFTKRNNYAGIKANELINPFWKDLLIS